MSRNNDVSRVLFLPESAGNVADDRLADLLDGEWGVFDYDTGLTVNVSLVETGVVEIVLPNNFFIAYRGDGTLGDAGKIYMSAGTHVQKSRLRYHTVNNDAAPVAQVITINTLSGVESGSDATNYDYGLKLDFRGNSEIYTRYGYNQATKIAQANTRCVGSAGASAHAPAEVLAQWADSLGDDSDQFISFSISGTTVTNTPVVFTASGVPGTDGAWSDSGGAITKATALSEIRAGTAAMAIALTVGAGTYNGFSAMYDFCSVNAKYFKQRQIHAEVALTGGTCVWGTIAYTTPMSYGEGYGYDINELEYQCGGQDGKPGVYRQSRLNGLPFSGFEYIAVKTTQYTVHVLSYDQYSVGGWQEYLNNQSTYIVLAAAPAATAGYPSPVLLSIANQAGLTTITN